MYFVSLFHSFVRILTGMRVRHWDALSQAVGTHVSPGEDLQLSRLLKAGILRHLDVLNVSVGAESSYS